MGFRSNIGVYIQIAGQGTAMEAWNPAQPVRNVALGPCLCNKDPHLPHRASVCDGAALQSFMPVRGNGGAQAGPIFDVKPYFFSENTKFTSATGGIGSAGLNPLAEKLQYLLRLAVQKIT
mgnify:CR=1 FL=1|jgi:hypothetical protein